MTSDSAHPPEPKTHRVSAGLTSALVDELAAEVERLLAPAAPGRYKFGSQLGVGGMGEVLKATDPALGRRVALKRLAAARAADPAHLARFVREARITA